MSRNHGDTESKGKLVDTIIYEYQGVQMESATEVSDATQVGAIKVAVKVLLHKKLAPSVKPPMETKSVWFSVECDSPKFSFRGTDIEALRTMAWSSLNKHLAIKWETYYEVKISHGLMGQAGLSLEYSHVYKGTAHDGSLILRRPTWNRSDEYLPWPGEYKDKDGRVVACIEATEENRVALEEFAARIRELRKRLADTLKPDVILQTLANLNNNTMLPKPSEQE